MLQGGYADLTYARVRQLRRQVAHSVAITVRIRGHILPFLQHGGTAFYPVVGLQDLDGPIERCLALLRVLDGLAVGGFLLSSQLSGLAERLVELRDLLAQGRDLLLEERVLGLVLADGRALGLHLRLLLVARLDCRRDLLVAERLLGGLVGRLGLQPRDEVLDDAPHLDEVVHWVVVQAGLRRDRRQRRAADAPRRRAQVRDGQLRGRRLCPRWCCRRRADRSQLKQHRRDAGPARVLRGSGRLPRTQRRVDLVEVHELLVRAVLRGGARLQQTDGLADGAQLGRPRRRALVPLRGTLLALLVEHRLELGVGVSRFGLLVFLPLQVVLLCGLGVEQLGLLRLVLLLELLLVGHGEHLLIRYRLLELL